MSFPTCRSSSSSGAWGPWRPLASRQIAADRRRFANRQRRARTGCFFLGLLSDPAVGLGILPRRSDQRPAGPGDRIGRSRLPFMALVTAGAGRTVFDARLANPGCSGPARGPSAVASVLYLALDRKRTAPAICGAVTLVVQFPAALDPADGAAGVFGRRYTGDRRSWSHRSAVTGSPSCWRCSTARCMPGPAGEWPHAPSTWWPVLAPTWCCGCFSGGMRSSAPQLALGGSGHVIPTCFGTPACTDTRRKGPMCC